MSIVQGLPWIRIQVHSPEPETHLRVKRLHSGANIRKPGRHRRTMSRRKESIEPSGDKFHPGTENKRQIPSDATSEFFRFRHLVRLVEFRFCNDLSLTARPYDLYLINLLKFAEAKVNYL